MTDVLATPSNGVYEQRFKDWFAADDPRIVYRNEGHGYLIRLDDHPVTRRHLLAVPFEGHRSIDHMQGARGDKLGQVARFAGLQLEEVLERQGTPYKYIGTLVAGAQVWHAHVHRAPSYEGRDWIEGFNGGPRLELSEDEWSEMCETTKFTPEMIRALNAELARIGPAEDLAAMEQQALGLRSMRGLNATATT